MKTTTPIVAVLLIAMWISTGIARAGDPVGVAPERTATTTQSAGTSDPTSSGLGVVSSLWKQGEWTGYLAVEGRSFPNDPSLGSQTGNGEGSLVLEPEYYRELGDGSQSITFRPFARFDSADSERTHMDIRELFWRKAASDWELLVGISRVFWGVTESQHLVDVINQIDLVEDIDGEAKLGQPMARLSLVRSWGIVDLFVLPGSRERTYPGADGRLRPVLPINTDDPIYAGGAGRSHVDLAARWSQSVGLFDVGVSHFWGTTREPRLVPRIGDEGTPELVPLYELINQTGIDLQATLGSWLWKLEAIRREGQGPSFGASTGGFEYTLWDLGGRGLDLGLLAEYLWDERGLEATTPYQNDLFVGTRLALNDAQSTQILAGLIEDLDGRGSSYLIEASRRVGSEWVVETTVRGFSSIPSNDPLAPFNSDSYIQISVQRHF
jgi:hypothetical protein